MSSDDTHTSQILGTRSACTGTGRILGSLGMSDGKGVVRMQDRFSTDIDDLWDALTRPERLARWLGNFTGDLKLGGTTRAHALNDAGTGAET